MKQSYGDRCDLDRYVGGFDMGYNFSGGNSCECSKRGEETIEKALRRNIGKVVNVYSDDFQFTGLVARVDYDTVKLITSIPSAPYERDGMGRVGSNCDFNLDRHCMNSHFGSAVIIPLCKITAVSVVEI